MYAQYSQLNRYRAANGRVRIVKYVRCSSDEQKKHGYTIKDQSDFIDIFCNEHELIIVDEYVDEGISATLEIHKRKALAQLIKDAKKGEFDIVVFKCIDRFFRNTEEFYIAQKELRKSGVTWLSIEESDLDPDNDDAIFKINIYLAMAEYEARKTSKRIKFNNAMRIKNKQVVTGQRNFHFPWKVEGEKRNRHLERNLEYADVLYEILDYFETHQSKNKTVGYFNHKYDFNFTVSSLHSLLTDTLLYGSYKGVSDYVEPYITKDRFDGIQEILKRNARYSEKTDRVYLFTSIARCRSCGSTLVCSYNNTNSISYRCNKHFLTKNCSNNHSISEKKIEKMLLDNLETFIADEIIKVESIEEKQSKAVDHSKRITSLKKEIERLNTMFRKGRLEEDEYDKEYSILEKELKSLEKTIPEKRDLEPLKKLLETDFRTIYDALDKDHKKAFWRKIIKSFTLNEERKVDKVIFF